MDEEGVGGGGKEYMCFLLLFIVWSSGENKRLAAARYENPDQNGPVAAARHEHHGQNGLPLSVEIEELDSGSESTSPRYYIAPSPLF